jgi:hypothetical protein
MYAGRTQWVNWELGKVLENECAGRLILMMPEIKAWRRSKRRKDINGRIELIRQAFKSTPWQHGLSRLDDTIRLRAMMFRPDGSLVVIKSRSRSRDSYHLAALVAHRILIDSDRLKAEGTGSNRNEVVVHDEGQRVTSSGEKTHAVSATGYTEDRNVMASATE